MEVRANGIRMNYSLDGPASAPVVMLSHSLATNLNMWEPQVSHLAATFRVLRYDTRGHGGTEVPAGEYTLEELAEDAHALLRALKIDRVHFVGLSMGGMIGQTLALNHPGVLETLALCDTSSRVPPESYPMWDERIRTAATQGMEPHVEPTVGRWFTAPFIAGRHDPVIDSVRQMIRATDPKGYIGCSYAIKRLDLTQRLAGIRIPTLVIVGEDDPGTPVSAARTIHQKIEGSKLVIIRSASHLSNLEQSEKFNEALSAFLSRRL
jgi:3-oxoadipate enol-lactonase